MMKYIFGGLILFALIGGAVAWVKRIEYTAERRGVDKQIALDVAKANQELAKRRETDATFDKMDARQHCLDADLEWVFLDGKSFCR